MRECFLTIRYVYSPTYRGYRNSLHVPEEPDEPEDVSVYQIIDECGRLIELSQESIDRLQEHILKYLRD